MSFNIVNIIILVTIEDGIKKKCSISVFSRFFIVTENINEFIVHFRTFVSTH